MPKFFTNKGFTLIELMVAISVIAILSGVTLSVINVQRIRLRALESVKKEDIQTIATALERYYADNNKYPNSGCPNPSCNNSYINASLTSSAVYSEIISNNYLKKFPTSPDGTGVYYYYVDSAIQNQRYCLCFTSGMETTSVLNGCTAPTASGVYLCTTNPF